MKLEHGPNVLRVRASGSACGRGEPQGGSGDVVVELQTNLDDVSPRGRRHTHAGCCVSAGALDVWTVPAQMKKDRPGVVLHVLVEPDRGRALAGDPVRTDGYSGRPRRHVSRACGRARRGTVEVPVAAVRGGQVGQVAGPAGERGPRVRGLRGGWPARRGVAPEGRHAAGG